MPSIYDLKPRFQALLRPLMRALARLGVTQNGLSMAAVLLSLAVGSLMAWRAEQRWSLLLLPATLFVRMALNALDGMMARETNQTTNLGAVLNELGDVVSDAALYLPLALVPGFHPLLVSSVVVLSIVSEMTGVVAAQIGASRRYDGPMGKSDRAFVFGALGLAIGLGLHPGRWLDWLLGAVLVLLVLTIWNRARRALAEAGSL